MKHLTLVSLLAMLLVGCGKPEVADAPAPIPDSGRLVASLKVAKVVAYRFASPGEGGVQEPTTLFTPEGQLDKEALTNLKRSEAVLTPGQVGRLVEAVYGDHGKTPPAACYDPHHIFLFYDADGELINAVEVCFSCTNLVAQPEIEESQWFRHDYRELARIGDESGIGMSSGKAEDFIRLWDERDGL